MRELCALRESCGVIEFACREFKLDVLRDLGGGASIVAVVVQAEILAATFASKSEADEQPP